MTSSGLVRYRWTALDQLRANDPPEPVPGKDPPTVTPYGLSPTESRPLIELASKTPKSIRAFRDGDEVMVPLAYAALPYQVKRFSRKGFLWEEVPDAASLGKTLGEVCQALYARNAGRYGHYDLSKKAEAWDFPRRLQKLFDYWGNTDYRWAVVASKGFSWDMYRERPMDLPIEAPDPNGSGKIYRLGWVLGREPRSVEVRAPGNARDATAEKGGNERTVVVVVPPPPKWAEDPPAGSPYWKLDEPLRETVKRSFWARMERIPGTVQWVPHDGPRFDLAEETKNNLANAWWFGDNPNAQTPWEALDSAGPQFVNILVQLYDRVKAIDSSLQLWKQIKYIRNGWWFGSAGFKVVYFNPAEARKLLDSLVTGSRGHAMARDRYTGGLEHQLEPAWKKYAGGKVDEWLNINDELPDCDTWREVDRPQEESVHVCVGKSDLKYNGWGTPMRYIDLDDIHIDWKSPVVGIGLDHKCIYDPNFLNQADHWFQAKLGLGTPVYAFHQVHDYIVEGDDHLKRRQDDAHAVEAFLAFKQEWDGVKMELAVQGKAGNEAAKRYIPRAEGVVRKLRPPRVVQRATMP
jgi:hypothetical protein